ncbi:histone-lysine N-methyltransferase 2C-like [Limanda limanda]|uniref:histone-lysine N-methyltransferase 2C-like n=1 Tax=Limanda limanda TaxID=27771 RepID=UPI0029C8D043|nr:histone-lysine N-methyltransferase 2C-like [Limanda limanda]
MPSEAQSQEPRDRGPPPPVTRAGRSAQLAKAAATSLLSERRSRGRPRKDGSSGRSAPLAPPAPPSPPPPPTSRKKGRSRGPAQIEDKKSVDSTEKKSAHKTEVTEKTTGRRRSSSRRKSNTNPDPEPSQERFSPESKLDPDPLGPTIPVSSPEPAQCTDEDRTSPGPPAELPTCSPGPEPRLSPLPTSLSPDHSPVQSPASTPRPAPDPVEEGRPGPSRSPAPTEVDCSPCRVPMETEGGAASPGVISMGHSPAPSPCSDLLVSPCPLEDEDSLSLLFRRSLSEDSGGSPSHSLGHIKKRLKQCAFCYHDDKLPLGQGRLVVFGPTPGYIPLHILNRRASSDRDSDCHDHCYRGNQAPPTCSSPEQCESSSEFVEQLGPIGLPHDINVQSLFDPTGQCCAHLQCAAWSEGVCRGEGQSLLYVDKAIDSGSTQVCAFCSRLGATLRCQETSCGRSYHFPCAAAAGAHQDWNQRHTLCTRHRQTGSSQCVLCLGSGDVSSLLMCCCCGNCYHGSCLDPPLVPSPLCRAGWHCAECRVCQSCRLRGDDGVLLVCERCDKTYHRHCLTPPLDHSPSSSWSCQNCRTCRHCGVRSSGQWANHPFLCESCDPALPCPLCGLTPDLYTPEEYLTCTCCYRCVHTACIVQTGEGRAGSESYICSTCRHQEEDIIPHSLTPALPISSTQASPFSISQPTISNQDPPMSPSSHSPVQLDCLEPPQSPTKSMCTPLLQSLTPSRPDPSALESPSPTNQHSSELQESPELDQPDPPGIQQSPAPSLRDPLALRESISPTHPDPSELKQSPTPTHPEPLDIQQSPAPSLLDPSELEESPASVHPDPSELQESPAPVHPDPSVLKESPAPVHPDPSELEESSAPVHPDPSELQESPAPVHPDPSVLKKSPTPTHPDPLDIQQSPAPSLLDPSELQESPEPAHPDPSELQKSSVPANPDTSELQESPAPAHPDPSELQESPAPAHPDPSELQESPAPVHPDPSELQESPAPVNPDPSELQESPAPVIPDPSELQESPAPVNPDPSELQESPAPANPDPSELQESPVPVHPDPSELQESPAPVNPDPSELQESPAPANPDPSELQESPVPVNPDPSELQESPEPANPDPSELQASPAPVHRDPSELQESPAPVNADPSELQESPEPANPDTSELQESPAPANPDPSELQESPAPTNPDPSELQESPAPVHSDPSELQESPAPAHPDPSELQESPAPTNPDPLELQESPAPVHPDPSKLQESPAPTNPDPLELQESPAPVHPDPSELQESPAPVHPDPSELQESSAPVHPDPSELQESPAPVHPDPSELQESPAPVHPGPSELQESSAPVHPDPSELQESPAPVHPDPSELQESPAPVHPDPSELQESPAPVHPDPSELQESPAPANRDPSELQESPAPVHPDPSELQESPAPFHPDPSELQESSAPFHPDPSELQESPAPVHPDPSELQESPAPANPDPSELQESSAPFHPDPSELQESPAPVHPDPSELQESSAPFHPDPSELQESHAPVHPDPSELQERSAPVHPDPSELQENPAPTHPRNSLEIPTSSHSNQTDPQVIEPPSHPGAIELETRLLPFGHDTAKPSPQLQPAELQERRTLSPCSTALLQHSPTHAYCGPTELHKGTTQPPPGPVQLQQSPTHMTSTMAQDSPRQQSCTSTSPTQNSTEEPLTATESHWSPTQGSPLPCGLTHSPPPNSQTQEGHSSPQYSHPLQIPTQDITIQTHDRPCSPTNIINPPQHSSPQRWHSSTSHSPAQIGTSTPHSPIQDAESTLDQESPGLCNSTHLRCGTSRDISTLNQDHSPVYCRLTQTGIQHASLRSISAPCSPSLSPLRPTQCSLSQPASPVKAHSVLPLSPFQLNLLPSRLTAQSRITEESTETNDKGFKSLDHSPTQLSSNVNGLTPERSSYELSTAFPNGQLPNQLSPVPSSMHSPDQSSPSHVPAPESLVHISTSAEHSSLTFSPCANETEENPHLASHMHQRPSHDRLPGCMEGKASPIHIQASTCQASASPTHTSEMPTSPANSLQACACSMQTETSPAHVSPLASESNPSAILAGPVHPPSCQDEEIEVAVNQPTLLIQSETGYPNSTPSSQAQTNATNADPVHADTPSSYSLMDTIDASERARLTVGSCLKLTQNQMSQRPTHPFQLSPLHVQSSCNSSQTTPASFSPPHCLLTGTSPAADSVSQSLSNITSDCSGQTGPHLASIIDVGVIHSPPRSSPAGQASPIHTQSTSNCVHSGPLKRQSPSLIVACVSPPHRQAQASETHLRPAGSPHYSPSLDTGATSGLTAHLSPSIVGSNPDMDTLASSIMQSSVLPSAAHLDPVHVSSDRSMQMSPEPSSFLLDDLPAASFNQASLSQVGRFPVSQHPDPDRSAPENQQNTALVRPLYQGAPPSVDVTSIQARVSHSSPVSSSPTQDNTVMPSTSHTSETPASPPLAVPSQFSPAQTCSPPVPHTQDNSVQSSLAKSPVWGPMDLGYTPNCPSPGPVSPVQPEIRSSPVPDATMSSVASSGPTLVSPNRASPVQCEQSPGPVSPVQSDAGPGSREVWSGSSPEQGTETERNSATTEDISMVEQEVEKKTEKEEIDSEAPEQEEVAEVKEEVGEVKEVEEMEEVKEVEEVVFHQIKERQEEEEPVETSEEEDDLEQFPSNTAVSSPLLPQPAPPPPTPRLPHSVSPLLPQRSPSRAGPLRASPPSTALPSSCSPHTPCPPSLPLEDLPQKGQQTNQRGEGTGTAAEAGLENRRDSSQTQSQEPVAAATEPTKDEHQPLAEPFLREEEPQPASDRTVAPEVVAGQRPMREWPVEEEEEEEEEGDIDSIDQEEREGAKLVDQSDVEEEEPLSPVLELDSSFDKEVMELMTSTTPPPSLLHLSSPSPPPLPRWGKGRTLRFPPSSSRPLDDLSIRLRQSPFSTEASPETSPTRALLTPPPLSPPSPHLRSPPSARESPPLSKFPQMTVLPLTPKIGMGKPAISKRKFSPGRARVKQGSWSSRRGVSPPSSSQDSTGEGGWDSPKPQTPDSPIWSMRLGRGSGFPGRRRSRAGGVGGGRGGGRGRSRLKTQDSLTVSPGYVEPFQPKEEEENSMHNTVVMFSTADHFTLRQDMCVVCGSFGQGAEGRLLSCSQCGQCYHPYCVNVKITRVVLTKGWRCLECTVCEACGEASDPARLLLCDDCDISYHTYCLDPPLLTVPKGAWKCKWCVWCVQCGSASPGLHCDWQSNYSRCGPCSSLSRCPLCQRHYTQEDLILQCQQCDRWVHAVCQGLTTDEEVEVAADEGFDCSLCRSHGRSSLGCSDSFDSPFVAQIVSRVKEPETKTYTQDGVCLTESGLSHLQSLVEPLMSPRRYRRCKPKLKLRIINQNSVSVLQTPPDPDHPTELDHRGDLECEMKSDSSPERDHAPDDDVTKEPEVTDGKRKRKPYRPGIGGFMVRQRGGKAGPSRIKLCRKGSTETRLSRDEALLGADVVMEMASAADQAMEKAKKRYRKKKTKLEEDFPSYLQEAFFGRDLLDRSRQVDRRAGPETAGGQLGAAVGKLKSPAPGIHGPSPTTVLGGAMATNNKQGTLPFSEEALVDLSDVLSTDPHILATGATGQFQVERSPSPFAGLDISSMADDSSWTCEPTGSAGRGQRAMQEETLDAILSPELDKMVTDGAILSRLFKIPELEGKDVEDVFTAVLSPNSSNNQPQQNRHTHSAAGSKTHTHHPAASFLPLMNGLMGAAPHFQNTPMMTSGAQAPAGFRMPPPGGPALSASTGPTPMLTSTNQQPAGESTQDVMSTAQRGMLKWEKEETLGELATVAPVLYCNTNFPQLREQHPDWSTRVKQIAKLWRKASSQDRAPFVQKARDNRAAQRINKVQLCNDPLKRSLPPQPPPLPPPSPPVQLGQYDPASMDMEADFRDPLRPRESEQEQEWKLRQLMRQQSKQQAKMEATQKLEQVKSEQLQQQRLMASQRLIGQLSPESGSRSPMTPTPPQPASPAHPYPRQGGGEGSGLANNVFLRPQAPPLSGFSSLPHSPHPSSPLHQPPSSPQMFSPPSSRPSSPWDPYSKVLGPPRPAASQPGGLPPHQQRRNSLSASPAHDAFGSPAPSPDSKPCDPSRALAPPPGSCYPPPGSAPDHAVRHAQRTHSSGHLRAAADSYGRGGDLVQRGGVFKAPMPPQLEMFGNPGGGAGEGGAGRRPTDLGSPHPSYAQTSGTPGTPRPDYCQQTPDPFSQHSPLTSRPSPDPYTGTPRPHSDPSYLTPPTTLQLDQFNQQPANRRPSPSHPTLDAYPSHPGTPRPSGTERVPHSPGGQRSSDPYARPVGTPRPSPDPYSLQPSTPDPHQSPGKLQDSFPRTPGSQSSQQPAVSEDGFSGRTPGHAPFEQGHMTPGLPPIDRTAADEMAVLGVASLDGPMSILPQPGDSEEKLRQRQRLRQLLLRQQQQKSQLRQEKALQEPGPGPASTRAVPPAPGSGTPRHWSQDDSAALPAEVFARPPPPYPGTVRPGGLAVAPAPRFPGGFSGEQQRSFTPSEAPFPRQRELADRGPVQRFPAPPGAQVLQDSFLGPARGSMLGSGLGAGEGVPVQMRRPMPGDFTGLRPLPSPNTHPHMMPGVPQPFLPRSLPLQQHSIRGQPYIELRHRTPESRLRLPFPPPETPLLYPRDQQPSLRPTQGAPVVPPPLGAQMVMVEQLNQQQLSHTTALPVADGMEEHMDGDESAVKDLEDVEVKDLVDLNLNLDPEDGKEDLDLGPNDLHLDDFLLSGKFDLIAYADPELNLEDKKDMFNEELDLGEPVEDKDGGERSDVAGEYRKTDSHTHLMGQVKQEVKDCVKTEVSDGPSAALHLTTGAPGTRAPGSSLAGSSALLAKEKVEDLSVVPALRDHELAPMSVMAPRVQPPAGQASVFQPQQRPFGALPLLNSQNQLPHLETSTQNQVQNLNKARPMLLEEQPLLLQELLDQERQEQQQQKQMQALIQQRSTSDSLFPNIEDFDSVSDPIMKAKMVALKGINKVMTQGNIGLNPMVINRFPPAPAPGDPGPEETPQPPQLPGQDEQLNPPLVRPNPPSCGPGFVNESQRCQYEEWLGETQQLLQMQQRLLEEQIAAHRKTKKSLSAKQRTARKAGRAFAEEDAAQLRYISEQQAAVQKQLEQIRKQQKDHTELIDDYRTKHQGALQPLAAPPMMPTGAPPVPQTLLLQPPPGGPPQTCVTNTSPGWTPGGTGPGALGHRVPPHLPPPLPSTPQAPPRTQTPVVVAGLTAPTAAFSTGGPRGPAGGGGAAAEVKFDDNNPFSEGFQERERRERLREQQERERLREQQERERLREQQERERLREQQERQRVQLMQEVERHRALQQRLELEQQGMLGVAVRVGPGADVLSQLPFFSSELPQDFLQSPPAPSTRGGPLAHQPGAGPPHPGAHSLPADLQTGARLQGPAGITPPNPGGPDARFGHESSSPAAPPSSSFPCSSSGGPSPLIIPNDTPQKKRSRKRDGDNMVGGGGSRTPLSSHSDDNTAPPTSCCTPTPGPVDQSVVSFSGLAPSSELERQLSTGAAAQQSSSHLGSSHPPRAAAPLLVKEEREDDGACGARVVKMEEGEGELFSPPSPLHGGGGDGGKELLRHLLKDKMSNAITLSYTVQAPPPACRQLSNESVRSEEEDKPGSYGNVVMMDDGELMDASNRKKVQRSKRLTRPEKDRTTPKYKRRKREEEEKTLNSSSSDPLMTHLRQLAALPLMEPVLGVDLSLFPPFGSSSVGGDSRLSGSFGNAGLGGVSDFYSQLIHKNNLSNPPTPPASLPPTPPPVARQKLVNGFATTEELSRKEISEPDVKSSSDLKHKGGGLLVVNHTHKTVDVPASLPTPPHNNQEELRIQDSSGRSTPDGFVPSSSPESEWDGEVSRYPDLSFIKLEPPSPSPSPPLPITPGVRGAGSAVKQEVKVEPTHQGPPSCSNTDLVTIAITLNPLAAQNVAGVMAAVAALLRIPVPGDYQLSRAPPGAEHSPLALLAGVRVPLPQGPTGNRQLRAPAAENTGGEIQHGGSAAAGPPCCSYCKVLLGNGVRVVTQLKQEGQSRRTLAFCSPRCSALSTSAPPTPGNKPAVPVLSGSERPPPSRAQHQYNNNMSSIAVHSLPRTPPPPSSTSSSPTLSFPPASTVTMETRPRGDSLKMKVKLKPHPRAVPGGEDSARQAKRTKSSRWSRWSVRITFSRGPGVANEAVALPTEEEVDMMLKQLGACLQPDPLPTDQRRCCFCHQQGDGRTDGPARLLNLDLDLWVHLNCALWSSEVYETQAGALINVELALRRGLALRCAHCQQTGATSGCNRLRCTNTYHFTCALQAHCTFFKDKTMLCHLHKPRTLSGDRSSSGSPSSTPGLTPDPAATVVSDPYDSELRCFAVFRRVYVQRDEARQIAAVVQRGERQHTFRIGSLLFCAVGRLLPQQMKAFHDQTAIFPVGYHANRIYWSMRHSSRRCQYMCSIEDAGGQPLFKVKVVEQGHGDLILTGHTPKAVWDQILDPVSQMRSSSGTLKLFPAYLKGEDLFGLTTSAVIRIIESLPGVEACGRYNFRYGRNPLMEWPLAFNPSGSARSEPKAFQAKRLYLLTSIAPRCQGSVGSIVGLVPGVISLSPGESVSSAHQGRHSKASQYRRMKAEWKSNVYLARSRIQGLGLYAARDIEKFTMVIEYIGTIIRSEVANRKERLYESQNRGVYMFRIDNDYVIDATITGGPARYINHSCGPNCITEVVTVEKENKIIISSCRRIQRGEELSYDYKFDLEDDQHKIPCHCGAVNCSKWMN